MATTMKAHHRILFTLVAALTATGLTGCFGGGGATISGDVKLDGKALAAAEVSIESAEPGIALAGYAGKTDEQGKFVIHTAKAIAPGKYRVYINKYVDKKGKALDPEEFEQLKAAGKLINLVPYKYNASRESELIVDLTSGNNDLKTLDLKSK